MSWFPTLGRAGSLGRVVGRQDRRGRGPAGFRKHTPEAIRPSASSSTMQRCAVRQLIDRETTQQPRWGRRVLWAEVEAAAAAALGPAGAEWGPRVATALQKASLLLGLLVSDWGSERAGHGG